MSRILVVSDSRTMRDCIASSLEAGGFEVITATSGFGALKAMAQKPDLIVSELLMPDLSGVDLARHQKKSADPVPIILVASQGEKATASSSGADTVIYKPFTSDEILAVVRALLDGGRQQ